MIENEKVIEDRHYIVFCEEHYNPLGIVRSLGECGIMSDIIVLKNKFHLVSSSKYIRSIKYVDSIKEGLTYLLETFGRAKNKDFLFSADDKIESYLDYHYDELIDKFFFFDAGGSGVVNKYLEKETIQKLAEECGFIIPKTIFVRKNGDIPDDIQYPVITKSISSIVGGWKSDVFICENKQDIINAFTKIKSEIISLQQYIKKDNELCLDGFSYNHGKKVCIPIASTYDYILPDTYSPLMTITNFEDVKDYEQISCKLRKMFEKIGFEGIFSVEFLVADNELYFLEINFRNSTWSYAATAVGMNMPILWAKSMDDPTINIEIRKFKPIRAVVEPDDLKNRVFGKKVSLMSWIKEIKSIEVKYYWNKKDMRPFRAMVYKRVKSRIKRVLVRGV